MFTVPFLQMRKFFPEHLAISTFDHLGYITYRIFWREFDKYMHMVRVHCHVNDLNIKFLTGLPDNRLSQPSSIHGPVRQQPDHKALCPPHPGVKPSQAFLKYHRPINIRTHSPPHQEIISFCQNHKKTIIPIVVKNETVSIRVGEFNKTADKHR